MEPDIGLGQLLQSTETVLALPDRLFPPRPGAWWRQEPDRVAKLLVPRPRVRPLPAPRPAVREDPVQLLREDSPTD